MRVILRVLDGPQAGRKALLGPHQVLQVGRTSWSDFICSHDEALSSVHFRLCTDAAACSLQDAGSRNGTFVNDEQQLEKVVLADGDTILAGSTLFVVEIEGGAPGKASSDRPRAKSVRQTARRSLIAAKFARRTCESGLVCCTGRNSEVKPVDLAAELAAQCPLFLLVDFHRLEWPMPIDFHPTYVYGGVSPAVQEQMSPVLIDANAYGDWPQLIEAGWGLDAVECLFSTCPHDELAALLSQLSQPTPRDSKGGEVALLGIGWPRVLQAVLQTRLPDWQARWTEQIQAVLLEDRLEDAEQWAIYGKETVVTMLRGIGLKPTDSDNDGPAGETREV